MIGKTVMDFPHFLYKIGINNFFIAYIKAPQFRGAFYMHSMHMQSGEESATL